MQRDITNNRFLTIVVNIALLVHEITHILDPKKHLKQNQGENNEWF